MSKSLNYPTPQRQLRSKKEVGEGGPFFSPLPIPVVWSHLEGSGDNLTMARKIGLGRGRKRRKEKSPWKSHFPPSLSRPSAPPPRPPFFRGKRHRSLAQWVKSLPFLPPLFCGEEMLAAFLWRTILRISFEKRNNAVLWDRCTVGLPFLSVKA